MTPRWKLALTFVVGIALLAVAGPPAALAAPPNDNFADAAIVSPVPFSTIVNTAGATVEPGEPMPCNFMSGTLWYSFTPSTNSTVTVTATAENFGTPLSPGFNAYQAVGPGFAGLSPLPCSPGTVPLTFNAQAGVTYYIQAGILFGSVGNLHLNVNVVSAPANDNFATAKHFSTLPFTDMVDTSAASVEPGEPIPSCLFTSNTVWYAYTPTTDGSVTASTSQFPTNVLTAYSGSSLTGLTNLGCRTFGNVLTIPVRGGQTYYFQIGGTPGTIGAITLTVTPPPPPQASFFSSPSDPSSFDTVQFNDVSVDPAGLGIQSQAWNFGDNATATGCCVTHHYTADGDYTVTLAVTTTDARTASATQTLHVRTHDVAITKFSAPTSASSGQTRQIVVGVSSTRSQETVQVQLSRPTPTGFQVVGTLTQTVAVNSGNQTTPFSFDYSFTADDANMGKVTFQATATIVGARDALPGDNSATAAPTTVKR